MSLDIKDLSIFEFTGNSSVRAWIDREAISVAYTDKPPGSQRAPVDAAMALAKGGGTFSVRANLLHTTKEEVSFWIAVTPFSKADLRGKLGATMASSPQVPSTSTSLGYSQGPNQPSSPRQHWECWSLRAATSGWGL